MTVRCPKCARLVPDEEAHLHNKITNRAIVITDEGRAQLDRWRRQEALRWVLRGPLHCRSSHASITRDGGLA